MTINDARMAKPPISLYFFVLTTRTAEITQITTATRSGKGLYFDLTKLRMETRKISDPSIIQVLRTSLYLVSS
jgi:hypothetical protein